MSTESNSPDPKPGRDREPRRRRVMTPMLRSLIVVCAALGGAIVGFAVTLAIVVTRARMGAYIFSLDELAEVRWETAPIVLGMMAGAALGWVRPRALDRATLWGFTTALAGIVLGILLGGWIWGEGEGQWAGAIVLGAAGLAGGGIASFRPRRPRSGSPWAGAFGTAAILLVASITGFGATNLMDLEPLTLDRFEALEVPAAEDVDAVVFLLGDGGATVQGGSPLLDVMRAEVEQWSAALARDSAVSIVYLGDLVYPSGIRERSHPGFETDSARLWNQIDLVAGEQARKFNTAGLFLTGNHDWGNHSGDAGLERVLNLGEQLSTARDAGLAVSLNPPAGEPGPVTRDLRRNVRIIFIDTHWFLQARSSTVREEFFERLETELATAGQRETMIVAHHPYSTAGPHGAIMPGYDSGIEFLLKKSGTLVQDLNSSVYIGFLERLRQIFESLDKPPLVFAGGHDHSLQVLSGAGDFDPRFVLVSGAGSKVSSIRNTEGLVWGAAEPGYMKLVFRKDDGVDLFVTAGDPRYLECTGPDDAVAECMADGIRAFRIAYSRSLIGPSKQPIPVADVPEAAGQVGRQR